MTRLNKGLIALIVIQLALALFVMLRSEDAIEVVETPVIAGLDAAQVTRLQIFEGGSPKGIDLVKRGTSWVVASSWDYPADPAKISAALDPLAKLAAGEPMTTSATRHKQLRVGDTEFDKKLVVTAGGKDTTLFIGTTKSRRTAVRIAGEDRVLAVANVPVNALSGIARDWIPPSYSEIPRDDIDKIEIVRGATKLVLDRTVVATGKDAGSGSGSGSATEPPRTWTVAIDGAPVVLAAGETYDTFAIDTIVSDVASITAEPADPKVDASKPAATISVTRKGKADATTVFDVVETGPTLWIKQRGLDRATSQDKARFEAVMTADRSKLVKKPDAPKAPGPAPMPGDTLPIVPPPPEE